MIKAINKMMNNKGFTLVELIVVLAVLLIIAAIAVPKFGSIQENSKWKADIATASMIGKAAELYYVNEGSAPANIAALVDNYLDKTPTPQYTVSGATAFTLTMSNGKATVTYNDTATTDLYPTPAATKPVAP